MNMPQNALTSFDSCCLYIYIRCLSLVVAVKYFLFVWCCWFACLTGLVFAFWFDERFSYLLFLHTFWQSIPYHFIEAPEKNTQRKQVKTKLFAVPRQCHSAITSCYADRKTIYFEYPVKCGGSNGGGGGGYSGSITQVPPPPHTHTHKTSSFFDFFFLDWSDLSDAPPPPLP